MEDQLSFGFDDNDALAGSGRTVRCITGVISPKCGRLTLGGKICTTYW